MRMTEANLRRAIRESILQELEYRHIDRQSREITRLLLSEGKLYEDVDQELAADIGDIAKDAKDADDEEEAKEEVMDAIEDIAGEDIDVDALEKFIAQEGRRRRNLSERQRLNEGVSVLLVIGILLAAPKIISMFASLVAKMGGWKKHIDDHGHVEYDNVFIDDMEKFAHELHEIYLKGTEGLFSMGYRAYRLMKFDWKGAKKGPPEDLKKLWGERTFMLIVAALAIYSGVGAVAAFQKYKLGFAALETGMAGVKGLEIAEFTGIVGENATFLSALKNPSAIFKVFKSLFGA